MMYNINKLIQSGSSGLFRTDTLAHKKLVLIKLGLFKQVSSEQFRTTNTQIKNSLTWFNLN